FDRKKHWEQIYLTKEANEHSWFQARPETSLSFLRQNNVPTNAKIIDIGAGDSYLVDELLALGYEDITALDISEAAITRVKKRLADDAKKVKWIVADITSFKPTEQYDFWHDRATFHFLTGEKEISAYIEIANQSIHQNGFLVMGTFSEQGPQKCSGIAIKQYSADTLSEKWNKYFKKINCVSLNHLTPFGTLQHFTFCGFRKL
ncbi:class I SAM-dependent methyltransferase, partial [Arachidicoccus sp.]|uniref:class I SAM-dependent methyltransferase n=1 Tax=Arachidicoccus sp. TaxID=1872624 RepID=UPI003D2061DA